MTAETAEIPALRGGWPIIGHALAFHRDPVRLLEQGRARHGDVFRFRLFGKDVYALMSPAGNAAFFRAPDDQLGQRDAYRFTVPIFGPGVAYDVEPELMAEQLRFVHPALRDEAMQGYATLMQAEAERYCEGLGEAGELDLLGALNELTVFIAGNCLIGAEFRAQLSAEFAGLYRDLEGGINLVAFLAPNAPIPANLRRDRARRRVGELIGALIAARKTSPHRDATRDFLSVLMQARYRSGDALSDDAIAGLIVTLLFAGQHTSAVMATWVGLLLMRHEEALIRVREEFDEVIGDGAIQLAATKRLTYGDAVLKEAERLFPPLVVLMRTVLRDLDVGGATIPAGALAMASPAVSHRFPEVFDAPFRFDPARFLPPREEEKHVPYALSGFGGGKHRCLGTAFAQLQVKVIWIVLLRHFDFELGDGAGFPAPDYSTFVVGPRPPCRVRYRRRKTAAPAAGMIQRGTITA